MKKTMTSTEQFRLLTVFCEVAEQLSFSRAARQLGVSQPAVSVNIATLEGSLKTLLFERRRPNLLLTPDGDALYQLAKPLTNRVLGISQALADSKGEVNHGQVAVIAGESVLLNFMPEIVSAFHKDYPGIFLKLGSTIARDIPQALLNDEADFALGSLLEENDRLRQTPIYHFSPLLLLPADHPLVSQKEITLSEVARCRLIVPAKFSYTWQLMRVVFAQHHLDYSVVIEAASSEVVKRLVAAGLGVAMLSEACATDDPRIVSRPFDAFFPPRSYSLIERRGKFLTPQAEQFKKQVLRWSEAHQ